MFQMARNYNTVLNVKKNFWAMRHRVLQRNHGCKHDYSCIEEFQSKSTRRRSAASNCRDTELVNLQNTSTRAVRGRTKVISRSIRFAYHPDPGPKKTERSEPRVRGRCLDELPPTLAPQRQSNIFPGECVFSVVRGQPIVPCRRWDHHGLKISERKSWKFLGPIKLGESARKSVESCTVLLRVLAAPGAECNWRVFR